MRRDSIQAVLFPRSNFNNKDECRLWLKKYKIKPISSRRTSKYFRFRITEPVYRKEDKYRIKHIGKQGIILVLHLHDEQKGGNLIDKAKSIYETGKKIIDLLPQAREAAPPSYRKFVQDYGDWKVVRFRVCRQPVYSVIEKVANLITLGHWESEKKKLNYDKMFHLFAVLQITNGKSHVQVTTEKNEVLVMRLFKNSDISVKTQTMEAPRPNITLADMVNKTAARQGPAFYTYDGFNRDGGGNCQNYVYGLLVSAGVATERLKKFVMQNISTLAPEFVKNLAKSTTDIAARVDTLVNGRGRRIVRQVDEHKQVNIKQGFGNEKPRRYTLRKF